MGGELAKTFRLSSGPDNLGMSCEENDGPALAGIPLLRQTKQGWIPRPQPEIRQLLHQAYDVDADVTSVMNGLNVVARALNEGDMPRAMIAAVQLRLPELNSNGAVRIAQAENSLSKYDQNESRDWHGRWTYGDDTRLKLPPGERIDELGDLLE